MTAMGTRGRVSGSVAWELGFRGSAGHPRAILLALRLAWQGLTTFHRAYCGLGDLFLNTIVTC